MIGRAAIGHPWIFQYKDRHQVSPHEKIGTYPTAFVAYAGILRAGTLVVLFRKHVIKYIMGMHNAFRTTSLPGKMHEFCGDS